MKELANSFSFIGSKYKIFDQLPIDYMRNLPNEKDMNEYFDVNKS